MKRRRVNILIRLFGPSALHFGAIFAASPRLQKSPSLLDFHGVESFILPTPHTFS
jgi:hypothetical protein